MKFPWDDTKPLRIEVALNPAAQAPAWRDVSALVKGDGVRITRGGGGRHDAVPPGRCSFTLDNRDGAMTPGAPDAVRRMNYATNPRLAFVGTVTLAEWANNVEYIEDQFDAVEGRALPADTGATLIDGGAPSSTYTTTLDGGHA